MKNVKYTILSLVITLLLAGCATSKTYQDSSSNSRVGKITNIVDKKIVGSKQDIVYRNYTLNNSNRSFYIPSDTQGFDANIGDFVIAELVGSEAIIQIEKPSGSITKYYFDYATEVLVNKELVK